MARYRVKAGGLVAVVGGSDRYLDKGEILPEETANIEHLLSLSLAEEIEVAPETVEAPEPEKKPQAPKPAAK